MPLTLVFVLDVADGTTCANAMCLAFSHNGKLLAAGDGDDGFSIWEKDTGALRYRVAGHRNTVSSLTFSPDDTSVISGSGDGTALVWDLARVEKPTQVENNQTQKIDLIGRPLPPGAVRRMDAPCFQSEDGVRHITLAPDGKTALTDGSDTKGRSLSVWDVRTGKELRRFPGQWVNDAVFSPDGNIRAESSDNSINLWDAETGRKLDRFMGHPDRVTSFAFSPTGQTLAIGGAYYSQGKDNPISLWDFAREQQVGQLFGPKTSIESLAFSTDGRWLACHSADSTPAAADKAHANSGNLDLILRLVSIRRSRRLQKFVLIEAPCATGGFISVLFQEMVKPSAFPRSPKVSWRSRAS